jgi:hypothetical protein
MSWKNILRKEDYSIEEQIKLLLEDLAKKYDNLELRETNRLIYKASDNEIEVLNYRDGDFSHGEIYLYKIIPIQWSLAWGLSDFFAERDDVFNEIKGLDWPSELGVNQWDDNVINTIRTEVNERMAIMNEAVRLVPSEATWSKF